MPSVILPYFRVFVKAFPADFRGFCDFFVTAQTPGVVSSPRPTSSVCRDRIDDAFRRAARQPPSPEGEGFWLPSNQAFPHGEGGRGAGTMGESPTESPRPEEGNAAGEDSYKRRGTELQRGRCYCRYAASPAKRESKGTRSPLPTGWSRGRNQPGGLEQ